MTRRIVCTADMFIPWGARVLARHGRCSIAGSELANGTAQERDNWSRPGDRGIAAGYTVNVILDAGMGERNLAAIANGPIMDPQALYLPAGKITEAEYRARQAKILNPETGI